MALLQIPRKEAVHELVWIDPGLTAKQESVAPGNACLMVIVASSTSPIEIPDSLICHARSLPLSRLGRGAMAGGRRRNG